MKKKMVMLMKKNNILSSINLLIFLSLLSKMMGFARDVLLTYIWGATGVSDSFIISTTIPFTLCDLFVQAITIGFIPIYTEIIQKSDRHNNKAAEFTNGLIELLIIFSIPIILFGFFFSNISIDLFASGFSSEVNDLAAYFIRITIFSVIFKIITSVFVGLLQSNKKFIVPAIIGIPYDICIILGILLSKIYNIYALPLSVVIGGLIQVVLLVTVSKKINFKIKITKKIFTKETKEVFKLLLPLVIIVGINQINAIIDKNFASNVYEGAITILDYANKITLMIENIVVYSIVAILYPKLSECFVKKDYSKFSEYLNNSILKTISYLLPITLIILFNSNTIVQLLLGRGAFNSKNVNATALCMIFYSLGIIPVALKTIYTRAFYSLKKIRAVTFISIITLIINIILNYYLSTYIGLHGLAFATSISIFISDVISILYLKNKGIALRIKDKQKNKSIFVTCSIVVIIAFINIIVFSNKDMFIYRVFMMLIEILIYSVYIFTKERS